MDIATLAGIGAGLGLIISAIVMGAPLGSFINIPGVMIVFGGTIASSLVKNRLPVVMGVMRIAMNAMFDRNYRDPKQIIESIVHLSNVSRKGGLLALQNEKIDDPYLEKGIRFSVDGVEPEVIRKILYAEMAFLKQRHRVGQEVFRFMGGMAPAWGMIGTLVGLVQMLQNLSDPDSIGPAMAVALLTTFYGAVLANLVFLPIAEKLKTRTSEEVMRIEVVLEGIMSITKGEHPAITQDKLQSYLAPKLRASEAEKE